MKEKTTLIDLLNELAFVISELKEQNCGNSGVNWLNNFQNSLKEFNEIGKTEEDN